MRIWMESGSHLWSPIQNTRYVENKRSWVESVLCVKLSGWALSQQPSNITFVYVQGEWKPKQIDNPNYKGAWVHPEIDNPEYGADSTIYKFDSIGVLGLDLWQVRNWVIVFK